MSVCPSIILSISQAGPVQGPSTTEHVVVATAGPGM